MYKLSCNNLQHIDWRKANACLFDLKNISVWKLQYEQFIPSLNTLYSLLHEEEKNKTALFKFEKDKKAYIIRRGMLRLLVSRYLYLDPNSIHFIKGDNNKPALEKNENTAGLHFNISSSGNYALFAIHNAEIGIDIEKVAGSFNYKEVLAVLFSENERGAILHAADATKMFYTFFTRKESIVKASAKGISNSMISIPVSDGDHHISEKNELGITNDLRINSFFLDADYTASVAYKNNARNINFYEAALNMFR